MASHSGETALSYNYLCRVEEVRQWMGSLLNEELPPASELEERLANGALLVRLGMLLLPDEAIWKKGYDLDERVFLQSGINFRHTDNINFWINALPKLGLPEIFFPRTADVYSKKNLPKLVHSLHALSHHLRREGRLERAVPQLEGKVDFSDEELSRVGRRLSTTEGLLLRFENLDDLVEEECQYQRIEQVIPGKFMTSRPSPLPAPRRLRRASKLSGAAMTPPGSPQLFTASPTALPRRKTPIKLETSFSESTDVDLEWPPGRSSSPLYDLPAADESPEDQDHSLRSTNQVFTVGQEDACADLCRGSRSLRPSQNAEISGESDSSDSDMEYPPAALARTTIGPTTKITCNMNGVVAMIFKSHNNTAVFPGDATDNGHKQKGVMEINEAVRTGDKEKLQQLLRVHFQHFGLADSPVVWDAYMQTLVFQRQLVLPFCVLPVYAELTEQQCNNLLIGAEPGAFLCSSSSACVHGEKRLSFRNRTGIKHWIVDATSDGKYRVLNSPPFSDLPKFVSQFAGSLSSLVGLSVHQAKLRPLQPEPTAENAASIAPLQEADADKGIIIPSDRIREILHQVNGIFGGSPIVQKAARPGVSTPSPYGHEFISAPIYSVPTNKSPRESTWHQGLLTSVGREQSEKLLLTRGTPGHYLVRVSSRGQGQYTLTFRGWERIHHCRIVKLDDGTFLLPPGEGRYPSLERVTAMFEAWEPEEGLCLIPLPPSNPHAQKELAGRTRSDVPSPTYKHRQPSPPPRSKSYGRDVTFV